jgi:hypothetical protein
MSDKESKDKPQTQGESIDVVQSLLQNEDPSDTTEFLKNRVSKELSEEQSLWLDVMTVALWDYKDNLNARDTGGRNLFIEVFDWVFNTPEDSTYLGTYENICIHLDIHPSVFRSKLIKYTKQYYSKIQESLSPVVIDAVVSLTRTTNSIYVSKKEVL